MLAFIGGTGPEGLGLAMRFALAGEEMVIGSRSAERAREAADKVREKVPAARVGGAVNEEAARKGDIIFVTVPYSGQRDTLISLRPHIGDKVVINVVSPLVFQGGWATTLAVDEGSAAQQAQALLPEAKVVSGFHHLDAANLRRVEKELAGDVIICGDDAEAKKVALALAGKLEVRPLDSGPLASAPHLEGLTAVLLNLNRIHKAHSSVQIIGIKR